MQINWVGTMFTTFVTDQPVTDWESAAKSDTAKFGRAFQILLENGTYLPPSQFEACFLSTAHGQAGIEQTVAAFEGAFTAVAL